MQISFSTSSALRPVIAGGSGSTGSSLLQRMLGRHPEILAGPEVGLFQFPFLFEEWATRKMGLPLENFLGIKSRAFARRNGAKVGLEFYGHTPSELNTMLRHSSSLLEFVQYFFAKQAGAKGAGIWVEKTPQNAQGFRKFLQHVPEGKVIHPVRDPYETMASLVRRGIPEYLAAGHYVYQTSCALSVRGNERYCEVNYADLVEQPRETLSEVCEFLGVSYTDQMLEPTSEERRARVRMPGWKAAETEAVQRVDLKKFGKLPIEDRNRILAALAAYEIPASYVHKYQIPFRTFAEIAREMNYPIHPVDGAPYLNFLKKQRRRDWWIRTKRLHPTGWWNYPGKLKLTAL